MKAQRLKLKSKNHRPKAKVFENFGFWDLVLALNLSPLT